MFKKIKELLSELENARKALEKEEAAANKLYKENRQLLSRIESAEQRGGVLLLSDLSEELVKKLTSMTDDNVFVLFCTDGTRLEIHKEGLVNKKMLGRIS